MKNKKQLVTILSIASIFFILGTMANVKVTADSGNPFDKIQNYLTQTIKPKLDTISGQTGALNWTDVNELRDQVAAVEGLLTDSEYGLTVLARVDAEIKEVWDKLLTIEGKLDTLLAEIGTSTSGPDTVMGKLEDIASKQPTITTANDMIKIGTNGEFDVMIVDIGKPAKVTITIFIESYDLDEYGYFAYEVGNTAPGLHHQTGLYLERGEMTNHGSLNFEVVTSKFWLHIDSSDGMNIYYDYIIES